MHIKIQSVKKKRISTFSFLLSNSPTTVSATEHGNLEAKQKLAECKLTLYTLWNNYKTGILISLKIQFNKYFKLSVQVGNVIFLLNFL